LARVYIPELASVLSAYGAATMDIRRDRLVTVLLKLPTPEPDRIERAFAEVRDAAWADLAADGVPEAARLVRFEADMRFAGQRWELTVPLPNKPAPDDGGCAIEAIFRAEYLRRFGAAATTTSGVVELVRIRAVGIGRMAGLNTEPGPIATVDSRGAVSSGSRLVHLERAKPAGPIATY